MTALDLETVEAIATRVVELLERPVSPWLDAEGVARLLNVERDFVYEHAAALGGRRLGAGPKARLRFRLEDVEAALPCLSSKGSSVALSRTVKRKRPAAARTRLGTSAPLLPIKGAR